MKRTFRESVQFYLTDITTVPGKVIDVSILLLNLLLCVLFVVDTYTEGRSEAMVIIDTVIVIILIGEFVLRLYAAEKRLKHLKQWYTIIDFLSILPTVVSWFLPTQRIAFFITLRVLRLLRVFRFLRFLETREFFFGSVADYALRVIRLITTVGILFFITSGLIYTVEHEVNDKIISFGDAFYFTVVTLTTVGFGDITPATEAGRIITAFMILTGIVVIPWQAGQVIKVGLLVYGKERTVCNHCGLIYHDKDASHCKHCGSIIYQEVNG